MQAIQITLLLVFPVLAVIGGLKDLTSYTIPNWISLALIAAFFPAALISGAPLGEIGLCLAVGLGALVLGMGMFAAGWIGGGDGKLFAVCALWVGASGALPFLLYTCLAGGALTFAILFLRSGFFTPIVAGGPGWLRNLGKEGGDLPYGVAIAIGALAAFPEGALARGILG
ncbi:prepilin peptidase [Caulobacter sp. RHG1]|uniref:A24 family peptidase n=1 Tax=Caulobacter sp. (strain RHG1) TaxID=2545762 RepID=UPI001557E28E|nr:prepilin peptidase [Caulobacter sp. RHG1]NQE64003.1 Type IV prepilin peptidase TadV/CpaA [Caulobacter sp. RHG1]